MNKKEIEKIFLELQFDDVLDILLKNKVIDEEQYDYYMRKYYDMEDCRDFITEVLDKEDDE